MPRTRSGDEIAALDDGTLTWGADTFTPYEASQKQRELERGIRATKRELVGLESAGRSAPRAERHIYTKAYEVKAVKLARRRSELNSFCRATGRRIDRIRTSIIAHKDKHGRIYAFGRKEAGKARSVASKRIGDIRNATVPDFQKFAEMCRKLRTEDEITLLNRHMFRGEEKGYFQTANAFTINKALRNGGYDQLHPYDRKTVRTLQSVIGRAGLPKAYMLYRYDKVDILQGLFGMDAETLIRTGGANGKTISMKQFMSTSMIKNLNVFPDRPVLWEIRAPKGSRCFTNGYVAESELVFAKGQRVKVLKIHRERGKIILHAEMVPKGG